MTTERAPPTVSHWRRHNSSPSRKPRASAAAACCRALNCWPRIDGTFWYHRLFALLQG
jgi:hypothetical protein